MIWKILMFTCSNFDFFVKAVMYRFDVIGVWGLSLYVTRLSMGIRNCNDCDIFITTDIRKVMSLWPDMAADWVSPNTNTLTTSLKSSYSFFCGAFSFYSNEVMLPWNLFLNLAICGNIASQLLTTCTLEKHFYRPTQKDVNWHKE